MNKRLNFIGIKLTDEELLQIKYLAREKNLSLSKTVRSIIFSSEELEMFKETQIENIFSN